MAEESGHTIIWSSTYQYELQPIGMVWANIKSTVGRQYTTTATLASIKSRLNSDFATLDTKTVYGCMKKVNNFFVELLDRIMSMEVK